jgi:hypothetical protein
VSLPVHVGVELLALLIAASVPLTNGILMTVAL